MHIYTHREREADRQIYIYKQINTTPATEQRTHSCKTVSYHTQNLCEKKPPAPPCTSPLPPLKKNKKNKLEDYFSFKVSTTIFPNDNTCPTEYILTL